MLGPDALLVLAGAVTAAPLLMFAAFDLIWAARALYTWDSFRVN